MPRSAVGLCLVFAGVCLACGEDKTNSRSEDSGAAASGGASDQDRTGSAAASGQEEGGSGGNRHSSDADTQLCGNGQVDDNEECDDSNENDSDGCTSLCAFTCHDDSDCQAAPCLAAPICDTDHSHQCVSSQENHTDGDYCGDNKACHEGRCIEIECNNGIQQPGEECDDGTEDDRDGCTTDCMFSCVSDDPDYPQCANDCDLDSTCDDESHSCIAGNPLADGEVCDNGAGYCSAGLCVASVCGDGHQEPNEECDEGEQNGSADSGCTDKCTLSVCGNGVIEGREQCDDGDTEGLDGCDSHCKIEMVGRSAGLSTSELTNIAAPDWCVYHPNNPLNPNPDKSVSDGNAFAKLITNQDVVQTSDQTAIDALSSANGSSLFHLLDVDDPTFQTPDPFIRVGLSVGVPEEGTDWESKSDPERLDFPMQVWREFYNDEMIPRISFYAETIIDPDSGKTVLRTKRPATVGYKIEPQPNEQGVLVGGSTFIMRNIMMKTEIDTPRSKIKAPPESADWVQLPETLGGFDPTGESQPTGILCGAIDPILFAEIPFPMPNLVGIDFDLSILCDVQYNDPDIHLRACPHGKDDLDAGNCSSVMDLFRYGCTSSVLGVILNPMGDPDADTDGDGEYDSYTYVGFLSNQRVKISDKGFATGDPIGIPLEVEP